MAGPDDPKKRKDAAEPIDLDVPSPAASPGESARVVVVVDDDSDIRAMLVRALGITYTVYEARDGLEARELLAVLPAPDAILCDIMMPRMDGLELAKSLRKDATLARVPILFLRRGVHRSTSSAASMRAPATTSRSPSRSPRSSRRSRP